MGKPAKKRKHRRRRSANRPSRPAPGPSAYAEGLKTVLEMADDLIPCSDPDTLYRRAVELAREIDGKCLVFTFSNHPLSVVAPQALPPDVEAALSPEIRRDMAAVVQGLGLGPNAGFDDVINALRARSGVLTETEAALLFLDEWRRQYGKK